MTVSGTVETGGGQSGLVADYVGCGGGLVMIGGYLSFTGIDGKARYGMSPLTDVLPVTVLPHDDRNETLDGLEVDVVEPGHPILGGTLALWPPLLSYNRLLPKPGCVVAARTANDLMLVTGEYGERRAVAFASDLAPHWAPPEFVEWVHYPALWTSIPAWAAQATPDAHATGRRGSWS
ncbi:hypothetical protein I4I73_05060 [Pseudonocardia sp. KRD-184]|uniref:Putative glutamine amidotransferase domain-containing protein n=1 Tax=Pseudonocardia oceani TaxID=2792013 RepID=A0ABS6U8B6_9PSEU|nr:hypothetical protein [Pseudonocardia oceani]MBW0095365.1 hypothetical protein [Pseudonocardia oceani]MBW0108518.1 hypothetical protein [Pseudonocardia oceani]MBW0121814.1 hypothetical protein [Pseudonocardia oceani]MBW0128465.1 hypothetical protein [Pseudonocardia oceani]